MPRPLEIHDTLSPSDPLLRAWREKFTAGRWVFLLYLAEIGFVLVWALFVGRVMLDRDPHVMNIGNDNVSAYGRFFWDHVKDCGTCALWSGDVRGGNPAYIDSNADLFHPAVFVPALLVGTLASFKLTIVICLIMGGIASWWLAYELGTSSLARIAAGCMGAAGGYLTGRSYQGLVVVMTSLAAAAFILPAMFRLRRIPNRRSAGLLSIVIGQAILGGQGYVQVGLAMLSPIVLILFLDDYRHWRNYFWRFVQAVSAGLLLSGVFLFPFLRYFPSFTKESDPSFASPQTFRYTILNLVVNDREYFATDHLLDKHAFPGIYTNYLGWAVILFATIGSFLLWQHKKPSFFVLVLFAVGALWIGSGAPFEHLAASWAPQRVYEFAISIRNPSFIAQSAAPAIIGLAAVGFDAGIRWRPAASGASWKPWIERSAMLAVRLAAILLVLLGLRNLLHDSEQWLITERVSPERQEQMLAALHTNELAWVAAPISDFALQLTAFDNGIKLFDGWRPWNIEGFTMLPQPLLAYVYSDAGLPADMVVTGQDEFATIYQSSNPNQYAVLSSGETCSAQGRGGRIDITCDSPEAGILTVQEDAVEDWHATVNGIATDIEGHGQWISVPIPAGSSTIALRYQPWDFWVGLTMTVTGLLLVFALLAIPSRYRFHFDWNARNLGMSRPGGP